MTIETGANQATQEADAALSAQTSLGQAALLALAVASGIAVTHIYYNQPMLGIIENDFQHQPITGLVPTATQLGYDRWPVWSYADLVKNQLYELVAH